MININKRYADQPKTSSSRPHNLFLCLAILLISCLQPVSAFAQYSYSADGAEVADSTTGLIWQRCSEGMLWSGSTCTGTATSYTQHQAALTIAKTQATASGKPWRLPNVKELTSITKLGVSTAPSIDAVAFPVTSPGWFWTSSPTVGSPQSNAWAVYFYNGAVYSLSRDLSYNSIYVRLVRQGIEVRCV